MNNLKTALVGSATLVAALAWLVGCSSTARHPDSDQFGEMDKGSTEEALANVDRVMGMGMDQAKPYMMKQEQEALALGKGLFNDPKLGKNSQTCNSCHPGGATTGGEASIEEKMGRGPYKLPIPSLVGSAARFPKYKVPNDEVITLAMMNNNCIRMFMAGKRLPLDSPESYYLAKYVTSLSDGDEVTVGK